MKRQVTKGHFSQFGAVRTPEGVEFTFEARGKKPPAILLFDKSTKKETARIELDDSYSTGCVYSACVTGYNWSKSCYLLDIDGKNVVDKYAPIIAGRETWMDEERCEHNYEVYGGFDSGDYKWTEARPDILPEDMVIYKLHLRGITMQNGLGQGKRGNFRGIIHKLASWKELGVTSLEFLPIYDFEEIKYQFHYSMDENKETIMVAEDPIGTNFWGYGKADYFAPKASYFGSKDPDIHMKEMVEAIHNAGMEIIMEMSFPPAIDEDMIVDCLVYWVRQYHIDGFHLLGMGLPVSRIANNPYLGRTKLFYDAFPGELLGSQSGSKHLFVTNDEFIYPLRRLQNHLDGNVAELSNYLRRQGEGYSFVNYAASNTGFTLWDVYSYGEKHNEGNGEDNEDGSNYNCSHNFGCEGQTANRIINRNRMTAVRTALCAVMLAQGIPMLLAGDEFGNTQSGNNNPYCQDNEIGWVTFSRRKLFRELKEYVKHLIAFRKEHTVLSSPSPMKMNDYRRTGMPDLSYHGRQPWIMGIGEEKKALGILYYSAYGRDPSQEDVMVCLNFYYGEETFALPQLKNGRKWYFVTNSSNEKWEPDKEPLTEQGYCTVPGGTISIIVGKDAGKEEL